MFKDDPDHDWTSHFADEYTYAAVVEEQMDNENEKQFKNIDGAGQNDPYERSTDRYGRDQGVFIGTDNVGTSDPY